jgi:uncharacterized membrane protein YedE/YeeE
MLTAIAAFACGLLFGLGLMISGMSQPAKVLDFLDLFGTWDASLALVMAAALVVANAGFVFARRRKPLFATQSLWPTRTDIDPPLIIGAILFGAGWGLVGLCPGPALVDLATLSPQVIVFGLAMIAGMIAHDLWQAHSLRRQIAATADG